jgi:hypothetical protein
MAMAACTVTDEHLQRAFRRLQRPHWPATLAEALEHPLRGRCVRGLAAALAQQDWRPARQVQTPAPAAAPAVKDSLTPRPLRAPERFDRKRAASGEREFHPLFDIDS